jgi:endonuclease/exonuclease/phosphatase family metal-dependent hydrolase
MKRKLINLMATMLMALPMSLVALPASANGGSTSLRVMTRNLYLGTDLTPVLLAQSQADLVAAVTTQYAGVIATNFPERAGRLADEIALTSPDVITLQEDALWRSQTPADFSPVPNATTVEYDFSQTLLQKLAARGQHYAIVKSNNNFEAEAPRLTASGYQDIRFTDRDTILARTDLGSGFSVGNSAAGTFSTLLTIPNPVVGSFTAKRGWVSTEVTKNGKKVKVVDAHLESYAPPVQVAQGQELVAGPLTSTLPVILGADLNSAAVADPNNPGDATPTFANIKAAGFKDSWAIAHPFLPGNTCCQAADLLNASSNLSERIDYVLYKGAGLSTNGSVLVGWAQIGRTPSGLWPSDHAGVVSEIKLQ